MSPFDLLDDETLRMIIMMFVGESKVDKFVGALGSVNKRFLAISRDRRIWERFYYSLFPQSKFKPDVDIVHNGPCTYNRCGIGYRAYYSSELHDRPYVLNRRGFVIRREPQWYAQWAYVTDARCTNPDHYDSNAIDFRNPRSRFKDMFKRSAMRYYTVNKSKFPLQKTQRIESEQREVARLQAELRIHEERLKMAYREERERKAFHASFLDEYKPPKKKKKVNHFIED